jgi:hypothetical protein
MLSATLPTVIRSSANVFAGDLRQALVLGKIYVLAGYGVIFTLLAYVVTFAASAMVISIRDECSGRTGVAVESVLYGRGMSPICGDGMVGQLLVLLSPVLGLALVLLLVRGPPRPTGSPLLPPIEARVRTVFTPIVPRMASLRLGQWPDATRITPGGVLFSPQIVGEFQRWDTGMAVNLSRPASHYALFTTLHELGHQALHDVLYSRGADRAIPVVSGFVALLLLVAMPAGGLVDGYWLSVILTVFECVAAAVATRIVLGCIMTNFEFLMDHYAASSLAELAQRRQSLPALTRGYRKIWLDRSHPPLSERGEYLRSLRCGGFFWAYLMALPVMALVAVASTPSRETITAIHAILTAIDLVAVMSLCILGVFGGASARAGLPGVWWCYGLVVVFAVAFALTLGYSDRRFFLADTAHRLAFHGRLVFCLLVLAAPLAGVGLRRWTNWFDASPDKVNAPPPATPAIMTYTLSVPAPGAWLKRPLSPLRRRAEMALGRLARVLYRGGVTFAAAEAAMFGFVLLVYIFDTGIFSWVDIICFLTFFAVPFGHAMRPLCRLPLVLDQLFQTMSFA